MRIRAPAKVNLSLRIVGKRSDGYHLLDTLMVPVALFDEITIRRARSSRRAAKALTVTCRHPLVPSGEGNLAYKAASLLMLKKRIRGSLRIHVRKRIPVGAGLGGGSSDAAATLLGLNRLFRLRCQRKELLSLAASLGADVPFFIDARPARARGIGGLLCPLPPLPVLWMVILYPGFPVSTRWAYQHFRLGKLTKAIENTSINFSPRDPERLEQLLVNDLEKTVMHRYPRIAILKEKLIWEGAVGALMSGSGSSVFGIFSSEQAAREAFRRLRKEEGAQAYLVRSLT